MKKPIVDLPPENNFDLQRDLRLKDGPSEGYNFVGPILTKFNLPKYHGEKYPKVMKQFHPLYVADVFDNYRNLIFLQYLNCSSNRLNLLRAKLIANERNGTTKVATRLKFLNNSYVHRYIDKHPTLKNLKPIFTSAVLTAVSNENLADLKSDYEILAGFDEAIIIGAKFGDEIFTADSLPVLFNLPSRQQLYSQILGTLSHPASTLAQTLETPMQNLSLSLDQYSRQEKEEGQ